MALLAPSIAIVIALGLLFALLYKRVNLGITLNATALLLAALAVDWVDIPDMIYATTVDPLTISVVLATFIIMLLSQLYKETGLVNRLSDSVSKLVNNPKIVLAVIPAIIGLLPVAGGALTSAPLVDLEAEKLGIKTEKKAYINLWFRHTVFPVYPLSQPLIVTAAITGVALPLIILRQIPVVMTMIVVGSIIGFWGVPNVRESKTRQEMSSNFNRFIIAFLPIMSAIVLNIVLNVTVPGIGAQGFDILISVTTGLFVLLLICRSDFKVFVRPAKNWSIYGITLAAYGAFLLRATVTKGGISGALQAFVSNGSIDMVILLILIPAVLGFLTGSPLGGAIIGVSILTGLVTFSPKVAGLIYISAYLGYTVHRRLFRMPFRQNVQICSPIHPGGVSSSHSSVFHVLKLTCNLPRNVTLPPGVPR